VDHGDGEPWIGALDSRGYVARSLARVLHRRFDLPAHGCVSASDLAHRVEQHGPPVLVVFDRLDRLASPALRPLSELHVPCAIWTARWIDEVQRELAAYGDRAEVRCFAKPSLDELIAWAREVVVQRASGPPPPRGPTP
jgi:hypothetical protein